MRACRSIAASCSNATRPQAPGCPHVYEEEPCPGEPLHAGPVRTCITWRAGALLAPGAEVCNSYREMLNDRSMVQYGFLQARCCAGCVVLQRAGRVLVASGAVRRRLCCCTCCACMPADLL
jgi:hypothetical protein